MFLPANISKVKIPPLKIQGIKSKLLPFIAENIHWNGEGIYYEPFMGSGVVGFNLAPRKAVFSDINPHLIAFYKAIQEGEITGHKVREYLNDESTKLSQTGEGKDSYYYEVRKRFNENHDPLDFLFLQRSNFNGMMRFNSKGQYNVPFCRNPERFKQALITKIVNQVLWVEELFSSRPEWEFEVADFTTMFERAKENDFFYLDPPYIDRHDEYFCTWSNHFAEQLASLAQESSAGYALSMWKSNKYRENSHLESWASGILRTTEHYYHVGAKESNRNAVVEALVISPRCATNILSDFKKAVEDEEIFPKSLALA